MRYLPLLTLAAHAAATDNSCVECHTEYWEDIRGSVHTRADIYCNSCHGGDPTKTDEAEAMDPAKGFIGTPDKRQLVERCGSCHADVVAMNFYGIRTDQLARYKTSRHGIELFEHDDENVAGCSDCHGYHNVVEVDDPNSPVYPRNLPKTCNQCHGNQALMDKYGLPSDILETYKSSVHGIALYQKKDLSVAHCARCHGSHGAIPPGVKDVSATCGKCHENEKKFFLTSVHADVAENAHFNECVSCHGHHGVQQPGPAFYDEVCVRCHTTDSAAFQRGQEIKRLFTEATEMSKETESTIRQASIEGLFVEEETALLEHIHSSLLEMAPAQHSLSRKQIADFHQTILKTGSEAQTRIEKKRRSLWWRKIALIPVWIFIAAMITALWILYKRLKQEHYGERE